MPNHPTLLADRLASLRARIAAAAERSGRDPEEVTLLPVSKRVPVAVIEQARALGLEAFGENRVGELVDKAARLPGVRWHGIGRLQTNKVRRAVAVLDVFHALDRPKLARVLSDELVRAGRSLEVYIQVNISEEEQKAGFAPDACVAAVEAARALPGLEVVGLMGMAAASSDPEHARPCFARLRALATRAGVAGLSMGMTQDFEVAIEEGATIIRVGSALFAGLATDTGEG